APHAAEGAVNVSPSPRLARMWRRRSGALQDAAPTMGAAPCHELTRLAPRVAHAGLRCPTAVALPFAGRARRPAGVEGAAMTRDKVTRRTSTRFETYRHEGCRSRQRERVCARVHGAADEDRSPIHAQCK